MKNPFKKKRGEGYIPPSQREEPPEEPVQSLATFSRLNQADPMETQNDALIPGTFGGDEITALANAKKCK